MQKKYSVHREKCNKTCAQITYCYIYNYIYNLHCIYSFTLSLSLTHTRVFLSTHREMELWVLVVAHTSTSLGCSSSLFTPTSPDNRQWTCTSLTSFWRRCCNILILIDSNLWSVVPSEFRSVERGAVRRGSVSARALCYTEWPLTISSGLGVSSKASSHLDRHCEIKFPIN